MGDRPGWVCPALLPQGSPSENIPRDRQFPAAGNLPVASSPGRSSKTLTSLDLLFFMASCQVQENISHSTLHTGSPIYGDFSYVPRVDRVHFQQSLA